jgi:hypothetical protein
MSTPLSPTLLALTTPVLLAPATFAHTPPSADRPASICHTCVAQRAALRPAQTPAARGGGMSFSVIYNDPGNQLVALYPQITSNILAAADSWASYLNGSGSFEILVTVTTAFPRAAASSVTTGFVANRDGFNIFEQGWAFEIRTGTDPNGPAPDMQIFLNPAYATNEL